MIRRTHAETLTTAYVAIGAVEFLHSLDNKARTTLIDRCEGEFKFVQECAEQAVTLDRLADAVEEWPGVYAYHVAHPFGRQYAEALANHRLSESPVVPKPNPLVIALAVMTEALH